MVGGTCDTSFFRSENEAIEREQSSPNNDLSCVRDLSTLRAWVIELAFFRQAQILQARVRNISTVHRLVHDVRPPQPRELVGKLQRTRSRNWRRFLGTNGKKWTDASIYSEIHNRKITPRPEIIVHLA